MTVIVGVEYPGGVALAADSLTSSGSISKRAGQSKIIRHEEAGLLIGFTSSWRFGQLLRYKLDPPKHWQDDGRPDADEWVATELSDAIKKVLSNAEWATKENERREGGYAIVGYRGRVYRLQSDFDVVRTGTGYEAVGAGEEHALGALHVLRDNEDGPYVAQAAVAAACAHSPWCAEPIEVETMEGEE